jgi:hypothetical protein
MYFLLDIIPRFMYTLKYPLMNVMRIQILDQFMCHLIYIKAVQIFMPEGTQFLPESKRILVSTFDIRDSSSEGMSFTENRKCTLSSFRLFF